MVSKRKDINHYVTVVTNSRGITYYSWRNDAKISFQQRDKYKMIEIIKLILNKGVWRNRESGLSIDTMRFGNIYRLLTENGLDNVDYIGNNWYKQDLEEVLKDLKLSSIPTDILKNKNVDKLKEILKSMSLEELIYLHESGVVNE